MKFEVERQVIQELKLFNNKKKNDKTKLAFEKILTNFTELPNILIFWYIFHEYGVYAMYEYDIASASHSLKCTNS